MEVTRDLASWRYLPHLRIAECALIAGVGERTIEAHLDKMQTRTIGRIRFVTTASFRRWLGETVEEPVAMEPATTRVRQHEKKAVAAGIRPLRFHDARHTFASWAIESGKSLKWVQHVLGHSSPELTLRTYAHLMRAEGDEMDFLDVNRLHTNVNRAWTVDL